MRFFQVESVAELELAHISRFRLAKIVHTPFFAKIVTDCYVKVRDIFFVAFFLSPIK